MRLGVLGATRWTVEGRTVELGTRKQRQLLAALALQRGHEVSLDRIVDLLWHDRPPAAAQAAVQAYVSGLRRVLEPDRAPRAPATILRTTGSGYLLDLPVGDVDAARFEAVVNRLHRVLRAVDPWLADAGRAPGSEELQAARVDLDQALSWWRGLPYADLDEQDAGPERARFEELRLVAEEDRAVIDLALGRPALVAAAMETLTARHRLRERLWALRALALARADRQSEALEALHTVRTVLDTELGIDPGPVLQQLQTSILRQEAIVRPAESIISHAPAVITVAWPLLGRATELGRLARLVTPGDAVPRFAYLVGDPGIGKTRLATEVLITAEQAGAVVAIGRCSQDDGAPPLGPWSMIMNSLGASIAETDDAVGAEYRVRQAIVESLLARARRDLVVILVDDLLWADRASLRVLELLAEQAEVPIKSTGPLSAAACPGSNSCFGQLAAGVGVWVIGSS